MKKIVQLSLIASLSISSTLYADTISEAFKDVKIKGEIKAAYVDSNF